VNQADLPTEVVKLVAINKRWVTAVEGCGVEVCGHKMSDLGFMLLDGASHCMQFPVIRLGDLGSFFNDEAPIMNIFIMPAGRTKVRCKKISSTIHDTDE
jgi:hypothetical protein